MTPDKTRQEASVTVGALGDLPASPRAAGYWLGLIAIVPLLLLLLTDISFYLTKLKLSLPLKLTPIPLAMGYLQECEIVLVQAVSSLQSARSGSCRGKRHGKGSLLSCRGLITTQHR